MNYSHIVWLQLFERLLAAPRGASHSGASRDMKRHRLALERETEMSDYNLNDQA